jgi:hypothetical protein
MVPENQTLGTRKKCVIGGLGALAPILLSLLVIDLETLLVRITPLTVFSYLIRVTALFGVGGLVAILNKEENDPWKIFQLGIAGPALFTTVINGSNVTLPKNSANAEAVSSIAIGYTEKLSPFASAYAQTPGAEDKKIKKFSLPKETPSQQIARGLFGSTPKNLWFVIAGSHLKQEDAARQAEQIRAKGFSADIYESYGGNPYYAVVIGAQLTRSEAEQLRLKAIQEGLPNDTYLWTFPRE